MDKPVNVPVPRTFGDLIAYTLADSELSITQRRNLASALRRFSRVDGRAAAMPCDSPAVRCAIGRINPARHGIAPRTWANIVSLVRRACKRYGVAGGKRPLHLLSAEWNVLRERSRNQKRLWIGLSRFITWAIREDHAPADINDHLLQAFHQYLVDVALVPDADARAIYRDTCVVWNRAVVSIEGWPPQELTVPAFSRNFSFDEDELPPGLIGDLDAYCAIFSGERPFDRRSPKQALRPKTLHSTRHAVRRLVSAAILAGAPRENFTSLASLLERQNLEPALAWYTKRVGDQAPSLFEAVAKLVAIGRRYLRRTEAELAELIRVRDRLNGRDRGMTPKNLERLRPFAQPRHLCAFIHFGDRFRREAPLGPVRQALAYQTALAHDLLLCAPMRFSNLIGLRIGEHLQIEQNGQAVVVRIRIPKTEVKNRTELTYEIPARVAAHLVRYVRDFRPRLVTDSANDYLFPGATGDHLTAVALSDRLCEGIRRYIGLDINPHLYRHIAAFIYLQQHPGEYETVRQLLGHKSISTTTTFYMVFEQWVSQRAYHKVLDRQLPPAAE